MNEFAFMHLMVFTVCIVFYFFLLISIIRQYRYATRLFDLLPFYPYLAIVTFSVYGIVCLYLFDLLAWIIPMVALGAAITGILVFISLRWRRCYSFERYAGFLDRLKEKKYLFRSFEKYFAGEGIDPERVNIFLYHDVDLSIPRLKKMIEMEKERGITTAAIFRLHSEKYSYSKTIPVIKSLSKEGIEIGFHYEVLTQTKGDKEKAIEIFEKELLMMRKEVSTIIVTPHGDKYLNRNIWPLIDKKRLGIHSLYEVKRDKFLSDAGGYDMRRKLGHHLFDELENATKGDVVQILIHADWWF